VKSLSRRRLLQAAGISAGVTLLRPPRVFPEATSTSATAASTQHTSFKPLKQIHAGDLNIGYAEDGPPDGKPVIHLHGWPYDIYSYVDVAPALAAAGYRVIIPFCAAMDRRASSRNRHSAMVNLRRLHSMRSR
jgi:hypothetical protein